MKRENAIGDCQKMLKIMLNIIKLRYNECWGTRGVEIRLCKMGPYMGNSLWEHQKHDKEVAVATAL